MAVNVQDVSKCLVLPVLLCVPGEFNGYGADENELVMKQQSNQCKRGLVGF